MKEEILRILSTSGDAGLTVSQLMVGLLVQFRRRHNHRRWHYLRHYSRHQPITFRLTGGTMKPLDLNREQLIAYGQEENKYITDKHMQYRSDLDDSKFVKTGYCKICGSPVIDDIMTCDHPKTHKVTL